MLALFDHDFRTPARSNGPHAHRAKAPHPRDARKSHGAMAAMTPRSATAPPPLGRVEKAPNCAANGAKLRIAEESRATRLRARVGAAVQHRLGAAILRPAGDVVANRDRPFLAVRNRADALRVDAVLGQVVAHGHGALGAERDVVFARAALVG